MKKKGLVVESDPVIEAYKKGIDRTLFRENLRLSVEDRILNLAKLQKFVEEQLRQVGVQMEVQVLEYHVRP